MATSKLLKIVFEQEWVWLVWTTCMPSCHWWWRVYIIIYGLVITYDNLYPACCSAYGRFPINTLNQGSFEILIFAITNQPTKGLFILWTCFIALIGVKLELETSHGNSHHTKVQILDKQPATPSISMGLLLDTQNKIAPPPSPPIFEYLSDQSQLMVPVPCVGTLNEAFLLFGE